MTPAALLVVLGLAAAGRVLRTLAERRGTAALPAPAPGKPNILLLVLDTVRAWELGLYGYGRNTTPMLQEWASKGVRFERALSGSPWTAPSHAVIFTGHYKTELSVSWRRGLDGAYPTLAEALGAAGYLTAGFVGNYLTLGAPTGIDRGFLHYEDYPLQPLPFFRATALLAGC